MIEPKKSIKNLKQYNPPLSSRKKYIKLDFNENTNGCSKKAINAIQRLKKQDYAKYPDYQGLKEKIAVYCNVDKSNILPTNGSDEAIKLIIDCFVEKNNKAIILEPSFDMYEFYLTIASAKIKKIKYNLNLTFPLKKILKCINNSVKIIILCNPNNPTGNSISSYAIKKILNKAKNSIVLMDEAYYEFSKKTAKNLIKKYNNLIITRTFSKAFGLAAIRAGYIISNKKNIDNLLKINSPYSINYFSCVAVKATLNDLDYAYKYVNTVAKNKDLIESSLKKLKIKTYPSKANFILAKFQNGNQVYNELKRRNILVRYKKNNLIKDCLRITVGDNKKTKKLLSSLNYILNPALIFDMDGVLIDVSKSYRKCIKETSEFFIGKKVNFAKIRFYKNKIGFNNDWDLTEKIIKDNGKRINKKRIISKFQEYFIGKKFNGLIKNDEWILDKKILKKISKKYKIGIVTGRPRKEAKFALQKNNVEEYFSILIAKEDAKKEKPSPEGIKKAMDFFKTKNAVYFGDTINDEIASKKAGIKFIKINNNSKNTNINNIIKRYLK